MSNRDIERVVRAELEAYYGVAHMSHDIEWLLRKWREEYPDDWPIDAAKRSFWSGGTGWKNRYSTATGLYLPGVSGEYVSTPDHADLDIAGDICLIAHVAVADWDGFSQGFITKWNTVGNNRSFLFRCGTSSTDYLYLYWSEDGSANQFAASDVVLGQADGEDIWVAVTLDVDNGASGNTAKFWTSQGGTTWTQLGGDVTAAGTTSIYNGTAEVQLGSSRAGDQNNLDGTLYYAAVYDGIGDNSAPGLGTLVAEADFGHPWWDTRYNDTTGKVWTINGSAWAWEYR